MRDLYRAAIDNAKEDGASAGYVQRAQSILTSERGRETIERSVKELIQLRDRNRNGRLEWNEFVAVIASSKNTAQMSAGRYWRMAPLAVRVGVDRLGLLAHEDDLVLRMSRSTLTLWWSRTRR